MDFDEDQPAPTLEQTCANCGTKLTDAEILAARENGEPFLCAVCTVEQLPVEEDLDEHPD